MSVSKIQPLGGANNFSIDVGATGNNEIALSKEYSAGAYSITSQLADASLDIYVVAIDGTLSGYTSTKALTATKGFNKVVVIGSQTNDLLSFEYKTTFSPTLISSASPSTIGATIESATPSSLESIDDTVSIVGKNFASNVSVTFTGTNGVAIPAKAIVVNSTTSLTVTRPDTLYVDYSPYTLTVSNPGVPSPIGSNKHILSNSITAGAKPAWQTGATLPTHSVGISYSTTLVATDADNQDVDYSIITGSLPSGLTLNQETGVISGTPTVTETDGAITIFTVRAVDTAGNYLDRQFTMTANAAPIWSTAAGSLGTIYTDTAVNIQLSASGQEQGPTLVYTVYSGALPTGLSLSTSGVITGTPVQAQDAQTISFTVRATDNLGLVTDRTFSFLIAYRLYAFTSHTFTAAGLTGNTGPTLAQVQSAYSASSWAQNTNFLSMPSHQGKQYWKAPVSGSYQFVVAGAGGRTGQNGNAGRGKIITATLSLTANQGLYILVGQTGQNQGYANSGAGGYSAVVFGDNATPLIVAGGGAGAAVGASSYADAIYTTTGSGTGATAGYAGDRTGNGYTSPGAGFFGDASAAQTGGTGAKSWSNGALGYDSSGFDGGFGGGGGGTQSDWPGGAGGGGYTGGDSYDQSSGTHYHGGGGSYIINSASSVSDSGFNAINTNGYVTVTRL
jgi:hypothetical protein